MTRRLMGARDVGRTINGGDVTLPLPEASAAKKEGEIGECDPKGLCT